jgi:hypothetical protein
MVGVQEDGYKDDERSGFSDNGKTYPGHKITARSMIETAYFTPPIN